MITWDFNLHCILFKFGPRQLFSAVYRCDPRWLEFDAWTLHSVYDVWKAARRLLLDGYLYNNSRNVCFLMHAHIRHRQAYRCSQLGAPLATGESRISPTHDWSHPRSTLHLTSFDYLVWNWVQHLFQHHTRLRIFINSVFIISLRPIHVLSNCEWFCPNWWRNSYQNNKKKQIK